MLQWPWRRFTSDSSNFVMVVNRLKTRRDRDVLQHQKTQENVERVSEMIRSNRRLTIMEISEDLNTSNGSVQNTLTTDLNMRWVSAKFVPRVLTVEQKQQLLSIALKLGDRGASDSSSLGNVITGDETWVYGYDLETSVQSSQWKSPSSPREKKVRQSRSNIKVMMTVFFDLDGIVWAEFVPRNTTVNCEYYKGLLERLRNEVLRKRLDKWENGFILHHDKAPCHTPLLVRQFLSNKILRCVLIHLIHRIWHRATSGSSPTSKWPWKVNVLSRFRPSRQPRQGN